MKSESTTIKDIARFLNISASTVSRALNNHHEVSYKTRQAVLEAAKKLDYQPNALAIGLVKNQTNTIGVLMPDITQPFYSSAISGIEEVAVEKGYYVIICQSDESYHKEVSLVNMLNKHRVDGLIICTATTTDDYHHLQIVNLNIPLVQFDRVVKHIDSHKVVSNDYQGAYEAVKHLLECGCRRIAHIAGPEQLSVSKNRRQGYLDALRAANLAIDEQYIPTCTLEKEHMQLCTEQLLDLPIPPDAIFTVNDPTALEAMQVIKRKKLVIPDDVAVVGFDDQFLASYLNPALTTVSQPSFAMGRATAELLIGQIESKRKENEKSTFTTKVFDTQLIVRNSSGKRKDE
ncbi:MAG: LacI family DNA-binding transcriptional regulator [Bacteroidota bacterium]